MWATYVLRVTEPGSLLLSPKALLPFIPLSPCFPTCLAQRTPATCPTTTLRHSGKEVALCTSRSRATSISYTFVSRLTPNAGFTEVPEPSSTYKPLPKTRKPGTSIHNFMMWTFLMSPCASYPPQSHLRPSRRR